MIFLACRIGVQGWFIRINLKGMKRETRDSLKDLAYYSSLGFTIALSVFIGFGIGFYLDRRFDTSPWLTYIGLAFGIAAAFRSILYAIKKVKEM